MCHSCGKELSDDERCQDCGASVGVKSSSWKPWIIAFVISFLVCWAICFGYFREFTGLSAWLSALLAIPVVLVFLAAMWKVACWSDCSDKRQ